MGGRRRPPQQRQSTTNKSKSKNNFSKSKYSGDATTAAAGDDEDSLLRRKLSETGFELRDMTGDGNCLFRALSDQLYGTAENHGDIRSKVCKYIRENADDFLPFLADDVLDHRPRDSGGKGKGKGKGKRQGGEEDDDSGGDGSNHQLLESYLRSMQRFGTYGGHLELVAFSRLFGRAIIIHQGIMPNYVIKASMGDDNDERDGAIDSQNSPVHLAYHRFEHYSSVIVARTAAKDIADNSVTQVVSNRSAIETLSSVEKMIVGSTGCANTKLIRKLLSDRQGNSDSVIEYLISKQSAEEYEVVVDKDNENDAIDEGKFEEQDHIYAASLPPTAPPPETSKQARRLTTARQKRMEAKLRRKEQRKLTQKIVESKPEPDSNQPIDDRLASTLSLLEI